MRLAVAVAVEVADDDVHHFRFAAHGGDDGAEVDFDVGPILDAFAEIFAHAQFEFRATDNEVDISAGAALGEIHRRLPGRVSAADDGDRFIVAQRRLHGSAGMIDAACARIFSPLGFEVPPFYAAGGEHGLGGDVRAATEPKG